MAVYSYSRSSEIESLESPDGIDAILAHEARQLRTFALSQGLEPQQRFLDEDVKWTLNLVDRPAGIRLMDLLEQGDAVVAISLLRIFSNCEDMERTLRAFRRMGVRLYIADLGGEVTSEQFQLPFTRVMKAFSRLEKRRSTERIKTVKENQRRKGRFLGGSRPFGYMIHSNGRLIENPMEQRVLKKIIEMKNQGKSLRAISSEVSTPMMPISFKTVQRLLKRHESEDSDSSVRRC